MKILKPYKLIQVLLFTLACLPTYSKVSFTATSDNTVPHIIELYTSEGCSSCPPADKWLSNLINHNKLYKEFIPLSFHVDYWNYLGHTDVLSSAQFTQRQRTYAKIWNAPNIYTPEFVLNGKEWKRNRFLRQIPNKVIKPNHFPKAKLEIKMVSKNSYDIKLSGVPKNIQNIEAYVALLGNNITHKIPRGENKGKTLKHNFVVLALINKNMIFKNNDYQTNILIAIPSKLIKETNNVAIAVWVKQKTVSQHIQALAKGLP
jgi:hypothetical protein